MKRAKYKVGDRVLACAGTPSMEREFTISEIREVNGNYQYGYIEDIVAGLYCRWVVPEEDITLIERKKTESMKYEKEIDQMLHELLHEDWMDEEDYDIVLDYVFTNFISKEKLWEALDTGVKNGYSVEFQLEIVRRWVNTQFKQNE